jgi:hypothetical protein
MKLFVGYALSHLANIHTGTPERPLSTQGLLCYRNYWKTKIFDYLRAKMNVDQITINGKFNLLSTCAQSVLFAIDFCLIDISQVTSISTCDIIETLASLNMIRMLEKDKLIIYRSQVCKDSNHQTYR